MKSSRLMVIVGLLAMSFFIVSPVHATPYAIGDVFASTGNGTVKVFDPVTGALKQTLNNGLNTFYTTGGTFDSAGNYYVTTFGSGVVNKFDNNGALVSGNFMTCGASDCESITRDQAGNFYVGHADGGHPINKYNSAGALIASFNPTVGPRGTDWVDLAKDQKTIFYTSEGGLIRRFDVSTNTQLANFNTNIVGPEMYALRILADGGVLVAHTTDVLRFDSNGNVVQTYTFAHQGTLFALNIDPDGTSFWTGDLGGDNSVFRIDIATGSVLKSFATNPPNGQLAGLSIFGEITQGCEPNCGGGVPLPGTLFLIGTGLTALGVLRRWRI